jgi:hypothetical protein
MRIAMNRPTSSQMPAASAPYTTNAAGCMSQADVIGFCLSR